MLTEHFIASIGVPTVAPSTKLPKDAAIFIHEFQPLQAQRTIFKKSASPPNCLAVSTSHIFAAQADKAVVHVYSRQNGNQEATVPFTERITSITLACEDTVLILGTAEGRLFLWETTSGRQVSTAQAHLQAVTKVVVDPTKNFLLSASEDSTVHVWSIVSLLSFSASGIEAPSPIQTFTSHSTGISALAIGHSCGSANFAISASTDKTCFIWDYLSNTVLRTYLLPEVPTCVCIDAADRAVYVGYQDGSVQQLDLYKSGAGTSRSLRGHPDGTTPIQPPGSLRWPSPDQLAGSVLSIGLSFDSSTLITGHENGSVVSWDIARNGLATSMLQNALPGPVTNLAFPPVFGFSDDDGVKRFRVPAIVKPKFGAFDSVTGSVPGNYVQNVQLLGAASGNRPSAFEEALASRSFPASLLDEGLQELYSFRNTPQTNGGHQVEEAEDFMALDEPTQPQQWSVEEQNVALKAELDALRRVQAASFEKMERMTSEKQALLAREQKRLGRSVNGSADAGTGADDSTSSDD